jgi:hypothetical protein
MSTSTVAPPAAAPAAAAPSTPAPVSTPAPAAPATTTPSTPSQPLSMGDRLAQGWQKAKDSVPLTDDAAPAAATPVAEAAPPVEEPAADPAAGTADDAPAAEGAAAEPVADPDGFTIDDEDATEGMAPADFAKELTSDPAAKAFFDSKPELKNKVFAALRRDAENKELRALIPDVATAKQVRQAATTFQSIDNKFLQATTKEGAQSFLDTWVREAMYVDDKGQPIMENGQYKLHPSLPFILDHIFQNKWSTLSEKFSKSTDERLQTAWQIVNEAISPSSSAPTEVPDDLKPLADSLKRQRQESREREHHQSIDRTVEAAATTVRNQLQPKFAASGLSEFEQQGALREIGSRVDAELEKDGLYNSIYDSILQDDPSPQREKALKAHMLKFTQPIIGRITAQVIREAKGGTLNRQADKAAKVANQTRDSKTEPQGTSITTNTPASQMSPAQLREDIISKYKAANGGAEPEREYVMKEAARRMNLFAGKK